MSATRSTLLPVKRAAARLVIAALLLPAVLSGYSVLTHEAIIDSAWDGAILPLLVARFPQATSADLVIAHSYSYSGCILQDMGYYPFGSRFFSDLVHYVRSGEFVLNLVRESSDLNEYAFALGALAHYAADNEGHSIAVNRSVGLQYPKLARKFGSSVTYEDKPSAHIKVEFGFDVAQVSRGNYAPQAYHDFIGFRVARPVLERAFRDTYSLELTDVFADVDIAFSTYRHTVSAIIPEATRVAWDMNQDRFKTSQPGLNRRRFTYNLSRASYRKEWGRDYKAPGFGAHILGILIRILPKIGPLKAFRFKLPTPETQRLFEDSFDRTLSIYRNLLASQGRGQLALDDRDFDTGAPTRPTEYRMADDAYAKLAVELAKKDGSAVDAQLRSNVLEFFRDRSLPFATKRNKKAWKDTQAALDKLQQAAASSRIGFPAAIGHID
jgi:hypothetical protein